MAWVYLGRKVVDKKYAGLITAVFLISFCLLLSPWYGVTTPPWFSIYGFLALFTVGIWIELLFGKWDWLGGGLANLFCLGITWLAFGSHLQIWAEAGLAPLSLMVAFISGVAGVFAGRIMARFLAVSAIKKCIKPGF